MPIHGTIGIVEYVMDLIGILAFSLSGAFLGVRKDFDVFGVVILAAATGLGGGLFRDTVIGVQPVAFTDVGYFSTPIVGGLIVFLSARLQRHERAFDVFDSRRPRPVQRDRDHQSLRLRPQHTRLRHPRHSHRRRRRSDQLPPRHGAPLRPARQPRPLRPARPPRQPARSPSSTTATHSTSGPPPPPPSAPSACA